VAYTTQHNNALRIRLEYYLRLGLLVLAALMILLGAAMVFLVPDGPVGPGVGWSFHMAFTSANITHAPSGIVFGTMGMLLGLAALTRKIG
jgi:hypothetical protein